MCNPRLRQRESNIDLNNSLIRFQTNVYVQNKSISNHFVFKLKYYFCAGTVIR